MNEAFGRDTTYVTTIGFSQIAGAQFLHVYKPRHCLHVVVNNSYLGLIRQSQRGFQMDFEVSLAFDNVNSHEAEGYGVDQVAVAEGLGCKAVRVKSPNEFKEAFAKARELMAEHQVPVVLEFILERVTNISMGTKFRTSTSSRRSCASIRRLRSTTSRVRCCRRSLPRPRPSRTPRPRAEGMDDVPVCATEMPSARASR